MSKAKLDLNAIPREKFEFANKGERLSDQKFEDKPISYFKDAWLRFRRNKASIGATIIIICIILFSIFAPLFTMGKYDSKFMDPYYAKMGPRNLLLSKIGVAEGTVERKYNDRGYLLALAIGVGADGYDGETVAITEASEKYMPIKKLLSLNAKSDPIMGDSYALTAEVDTYLNVGFIYRPIEQQEFEKIRAWEEETGIHVLYPLIDTESKYYPKDLDPEGTNANYWYRANKKLHPLDERGKKIEYSEGTDFSDVTFTDNYLRDENGDLVYWKYTGGGTLETAQYNVRVLYYNWYLYQNGFEPEYLFGTDSQGYDLALRMAVGIRLSLLVAVFVSVINFVLGAIYGAIEGYYGGTVDIVLERVSDILAGVPFVVVSTLFQLHLAKKVGPIPSLLFAFVVTGWIGTASRVRTQFYRFKNQEYVMAARTLGARDRRIIWKHIFPNSLGTIITSSALVIPSVIFSESMLSFLGIVNLGGSSMTSLGTLLSDASSIWTTYPHLMIFPAIVISLLMISFNLFGNGLRDAFNPSLRGVED